MSELKEHPGWISRHLARSKEKAVLATVMRKTDNHPYASLVLTASDFQGNPLVYISNLAEHTKNLWENEKVSMLFENTSGLNDPLSGARVTLQGTMTENKNPLLLERFHKRHEQSRKYGTAHDFFLFQMKVERAHLVAGFGRIHWIQSDEYLFDVSQTDGFDEHEDGIVKHMNEDHTDALDLFARHLLGQKEEGWKMTGIDPEGFDMRHRDLVIRYDFDEPLKNAGDSRPVMVDLVKQARAKAEETTVSV